MPYGSMLYLITCSGDDHRLLQSAGLDAQTEQIGDMIGYLVAADDLRGFLQHYRMVMLCPPSETQYAGVQEVKAQECSRLLNERIAFGSWDLGIDSVFATTLNQAWEQLQSFGYEGLEVSKAPPVYPPIAENYFQVVLFQSLQDLEESENGQLDASMLIDPRLLSDAAVGFNHNSSGVPLSIDPSGRGFLYGPHRLDLWVSSRDPSLSEISGMLTENLASLVELKQLSSDAMATETTVRRERLRAAECEGVVAAILQGMESTISQLGGQKAAAQFAFETVQNELAGCNRELLEARQRIFDAADGMDAKRALIASQYQTLMHIPKVQSVAVGKNGSIRFWTDVLTAYDKRSGKTHEIGEFLIELTPKEREPERRVKWTNQTRVVHIGDRVMYAPHVHSSGYPCWGSFRDSLPQAVGQYRISDAIIMAIAMVERVNVADRYGACITAWPEWNPGD